MNLELEVCYIHLEFVFSSHYFVCDEHRPCMHTGFELGGGGGGGGGGGIVTLLTICHYSHAPDQPYSVTELMLSQCRPCDQL